GGEVRGGEELLLEGDRVATDDEVLVANRERVECKTEIVERVERLTGAVGGVRRGLRFAVHVVDLVVVRDAEGEDDFVEVVRNDAVLPVARIRPPRVPRGDIVPGPRHNRGHGPRFEDFDFQSGRLAPRTTRGTLETVVGEQPKPEWHHG